MAPGYQGGYMEIAVEHESPGMTSSKSRKQSREWERERNKPNEALRKEDYILRGEALNAREKAENISKKSVSRDQRLQCGDKVMQHAFVEASSSLRCKMVASDVILREHL